MNLQVTGRVNDFQFMPLEEAAYYQYTLGSASPFDSALRFAAGFVRNAPFAEGNMGTAFLAVATFLAINGFELSLNDTDVVGWFQELISAPSNEALAQAVHSADLHETADVHEAASAVLARFPNAIRDLAAKEARSASAT